MLPTFWMRCSSMGRQSTSPAASRTCLNHANCHPHSFSVVLTVRSEEKGQIILHTYTDVPRDRLSFSVVEDIAVEGTFDEVSTHPLTSLS